MPYQRKKQQCVISRFIHGTTGKTLSTINRMVFYVFLSATPQKPQRFPVSNLIHYDFKARIPSNLSHRLRLMNWFFVALSGRSTKAELILWKPSRQSVRGTLSVSADSTEVWSGQTRRSPGPRYETISALSLSLSVRSLSRNIGIVVEWIVAVGKMHHHIIGFFPVRFWHENSIADRSIKIEKKKGLKIYANAVQL